MLFAALAGRLVEQDVAIGQISVGELLEVTQIRLAEVGEAKHCRQKVGATKIGLAEICPVDLI